MNIAFLLLAWSVYFYLHSLLADTAIKAFIIKQLSIPSEHSYRIGYNLFAILGILILCWLQFSISADLLFKTSLTSNYIAFIIMAMGLAFMIVSIKNYDWKGFIGLTNEKRHSLVIGGMNKYVRHPLYSTTLLFVCGFFIWQPYTKNVLLVLLMFIYLLIGIFYEERKLVKIYGTAYQDYQKRVKKLIPFIW